MIILKIFFIFIKYDEKNQPYLVVDMNRHKKSMKLKV